MKRLFYLLYSLLCFYSCDFSPTNPSHTIPQSGASLALDAWTLQRSYPYQKINSQKITQAYQQQTSLAVDRNSQANWEGIGPMNIAGRTLALAFHPIDSNLLFLGSASGGLWKTTSAGLGERAWERVNIGFPILAVSCIVISPQNPNIIYIGTGEMYNTTESKPGVVNRLTRGTYGFGIFKSTDGGISWEQSLDWSYEEMQGVQDIVINPLNPAILYAATSIGLMKSPDAGNNWALVHDLPMAVDVAIHPVDTNIIYVSYGSLFAETTGIYRSRNGGVDFTQLKLGIPTNYTGKAKLAIDPNSPNIVYASVADAFKSIGLFKSNNDGDSWVRVNDSDIAIFQGWYAHDVTVNPNNSQTVIQVGIDSWKSDNGGFTMNQQTSWINARFGKNPVGEADGPPNYVHSDIHQAIFHPLMTNTLFLATDGGVFVSKDGGITYESRNGGLQTAQFYANFSNSSTNKDLAIGGMQDNSTAIYTGEAAWTKVLSGDGMSTAIDFESDNIIYGSAQFLNIFRSVDGGQSFKDIAPGAIEPIFRAPFEIAPSNPRVLYAGGRLLFKSTDRGNNWTTPNSWFIDNGNAILAIAIAPYNFNKLLVSTAPNVTGKANIFSSLDGGINWTKLSGLPDRIVTDFAFHPTNEHIAFITFGGFGSFHIYQTMDGGNNWFPIDNNLPDIPHNTIIIDPERPDNIYVGNDLGVYVSEDNGGNWTPFMEGLPEVVLAMHLSISPANQKLRIATHGNGVFQTDLVGKVVSSISEIATPDVINLEQNFPNPAIHQTTIPFELSEPSLITLKIYDLKGSLVSTKKIAQQFLQGKQQISISINQLSAGNYVYQITGITKGGQIFSRSKRLVVGQKK
ncbi:MAG: T9SS type A sorting domain-containing protein [Saprospiraceae bacterium]